MRNASTTFRRLAIFFRLASRGGLAHVAAQLLATASSMSMRLEHLADRLAAHAGGEAVLTVLLAEPVDFSSETSSPFEQRRRLRVDDDVALAVENLLEVLQRDVEQVADAATAATSGTRCAPPGWPG